MPGIFKEKKKDSALFADVRATFAAQDGGCSFLPRCPHAVKRCGLEQPPLINVSTGHLVACHLR
jgi:oligopeptide/dipeptide ABC transporter ATP-binding protein